MYNKVSTDIGKIYCSYDEEKDIFYKIRITDVKEVDGSIQYFYRRLNDDFRFDEKMLEESIPIESYNDLKKDWVFLKSEGIVSLANIIAIRSEYQNIRDVVLIFFPNNKVTGYPISEYMSIVARQGINNVYDLLGNSVGVSVSIDNIPSNYVLSDFMENEGVIDSKLTHVYKTDILEDLVYILDNDTTNNTLSDLYEHELQFRKNTITGYEDYYNGHKDDDKSLECLNGYTKCLSSFIDHVGFMEDLFHNMGITIVDDSFEMESGKQLNSDDVLLLSTMYGGIRIDKAVPMKFGYDIDLDMIKMKYLLLRDTKNDLWIVPYTTSPDEFDPKPMYDLTEETTYKLQKRLLRCMKVADPEESDIEDKSDI